MQSNLRSHCLLDWMVYYTHPKLHAFLLYNVSIYYYTLLKSATDRRYAIPQAHWRSEIFVKMVEGSADSLQI